MIDTEAVLNSDFQGGCSNCTYGNGQMKELSYCPYCWVENQGPTVNVLSTHPPTIAFDLDGTLAVYDGWKGSDHFGAMRTDYNGYSSSDALKELKDRGYRIIIWTTRGDTDSVKNWLESNDIPFDFINENPDQPPDSSQKIIADLYPDDRAIDARKPLREIVDEIEDRLSSHTQNGEQEYGVTDYVKPEETDEPTENTSSQEAVLRAKLATMEAQAATAKTPGVGEKVYHEGQYVLSSRGKAYEHSGLAYSRHRVGAFSWAAKHHYTAYKAHLEAAEEGDKDTPKQLSAAAKHYRAYEANNLASKLTETLSANQRRELVENVWNTKYLDFQYGDEKGLKTILVNPSYSEMKNLLEKSELNEGKGVVSSSGTHYFWTNPENEPHLHHNAARDFLHQFHGENKRELSEAHYKLKDGLIQAFGENVYHPHPLFPSGIVENVWNEESNEPVDNVQIDPHFKPDEEQEDEGGFWFGNKDIGGGHSVQLIKDRSEMYPGTYSYHFNHTLPEGKTLYGKEATGGDYLKPHHVANAIANLLLYSLQKHQPGIVSIKSTGATPTLSSKKLNLYHRVINQIAHKIPYKIDRRPSDIKLTRKPVTEVVRQRTDNVEIDPNFEPDEEYERGDGTWTGVKHLPNKHSVTLERGKEEPREYKFTHTLPGGRTLFPTDSTSEFETAPHHIINAVANLFRYSLLKHKPESAVISAIGEDSAAAKKKASIYHKALKNTIQDLPYNIERNGNDIWLERIPEVANYNPSNPRDTRGKWNEGDQLKVEIKGKPYNLTKVADGWHVVALEQKTDRLHKNYVVGTNEQGLARECSCPDFVYRGGCCKHMSAVNGLESETRTTENIENDEIGHELEHGQLYTARVNSESGNAGTSYRINTKSNPETGRSGVSGIYKPVGRGFINKSLEDHFPIPPDSQHIREVAAYVVAKHLGMEDMVPRTVFRRGHLNLLRALKDPNNKEMYGRLFVNSGKPENKFYIEHSHHIPGSMQHFIKSGLDPRDPSVPPQFMYGSSSRDIHRAAAFDYIIGNMDRNITNWILQKGMRRNPYKKGKMEARYDLKLNDHGYSFPGTYTGTVNLLGSNEGFSDIKDHAHTMKIPDEIYQYRDRWPAIEKDLETIQDHEGNKLDKPAIERAAHRFDLITSGAYERYGHLPNNRQLAAHHLDPENE